MLLPSSASRSEQRRSGEPCLCSLLCLCSLCLHVVGLNAGRSSGWASAGSEEHSLKGLCTTDTPTLKSARQPLYGRSMSLTGKGMCRQAEEDNAVRYEELGLDRRHNRYWHFAPGNEPGTGLIYVELQVSPAFLLIL